MKKVLWTSKNNKWKIGIVEWHPNSKKSWNKYAISDGWFTQYPTVYDDNTIGYSYPYKLPKYVKEKAKELLLAS